MLMSRKAIWPVGLVVILFLTSAYLFSGSSTSQLFSFSSSAALAPSERILNILPLGDSITWGLGSNSGNGYRQPLARTLKTTTGYTANYLGTLSTGEMPNNQHEGYPNATITDLHEHLKTSLPTLTGSPPIPDLVLLHIGTNDVGHGLGADTMTPDLISLLEEIFLALPDTTLLLSNIMRCACDGDMPRVVREYNTAMNGLGKMVQFENRKILVVDQESVDLMSGLEGDAYDMVHPNDSGYMKMAGNFLRAIRVAVEMGYV